MVDDPHATALWGAARSFVSLGFAQRGLSLCIFFPGAVTVRKTVLERLSHEDLNSMVLLSDVDTIFSLKSALFFLFKNNIYLLTYSLMCVSRLCGCPRRP